MLPYSPLHHLLLADAGIALVMTSGNLSDEPIAYRDGEALAPPRLDRRRLPAPRPPDRDPQRRLGAPLAGPGAAPGATADPALARLRAAEHRAARRRRAGRCSPAAPSSRARSASPREGGPGSAITSATCKNYETLSSFREGIEHFEHLFAVEPELVAHDLHPDYLSTRYALEREGVESVAVQHHHAHLAACLAEHGERGPAVGAIFDGSRPRARRHGLGRRDPGRRPARRTSGSGSSSRCGCREATRRSREPWRMACSWLAAAFESERPPIPPALARRGRRPATGRRSAGWSQTGLGSPLTTSAGRLFDAVAALCGLRDAGRLRGPGGDRARGGRRAPPSAAPIRCRHRRRAPTPGAARSSTPARRSGASGRRPRRAAPSPTGSRPASTTALAAATATACARVARARAGSSCAVLSGGVFQNRLLVERTAERLAPIGLRVLIPRRLPPNDGGIAYGQVGGRRRERGAASR